MFAAGRLSTSGDGLTDTVRARLTCNAGQHASRLALPSSAPATCPRQGLQVLAIASVYWRAAAMLVTSMVAAPSRLRAPPAPISPSWPSPPAGRAPRCRPGPPDASRRGGGGGCSEGSAGLGRARGKWMPTRLSRNGQAIVWLQKVAASEIFQPADISGGLMALSECIPECPNLRERVS